MATIENSLTVKYLLLLLEKTRGRGASRAHLMVVGYVGTWLAV